MPSQPGGLAGVVANVGERVQELLDSAERVASDIRSEAEASSARYAEERRREADRVLEERLGELAVLNRSLSSRVEAVEREARALVADLEQAHSRLQALGSAQARGAPQEAATTNPRPVAYPGRDSRAKLPEQAMLRATQMAVAGTDRSEIERMLRDEFGIVDAAAAVDRMLNSEPA